MLTIVCEKPGDLRAVERALPELASNDLLLKILRVGLCGTDYHIYGGRQPFLNYPRVIGHELAGEVVRAPPGSDFQVGQLVAINPYLACGHCVACRRGKPNCCVEIKVLGVHADGGMCEYLAVPQTAAIDATGISVDEAAMIEFLAVGAHAVRRAGLSPKDRVLVRGAGPIGIAAALFARLDGADVTLSDLRPARLAYAREAFGFTELVEADERRSAVFAERTGGDFFDTVFDATGNIEAMREGLSFVAHGGAYVLISVVKDDLVFPDPEFHKRETTLLASRNALAEDFVRAIAAVRTGAIPTAALNTHKCAAVDIPERMAELIASADHVLKAIVSFE